MATRPSSLSFLELPTSLVRNLGVSQVAMLPEQVAWSWMELPIPQPTEWSQIPELM